MSWIKRFAVCAAAIGALAVSGATAMADCVRGDFVGWDSNDWMLEFNAGNYYALTVQATTNGSAMKFNNGSTWWGAGTSAVTNSSIGAAVSSSDSGNLALPVTSGQWYTFHVTGHGEWGTRQYLVMKTQYKPAVINTVTDTHATAFEEDVSVEVTCELSADTPRISDEEVFYLVYTADGWATQTRQVMTKSGITARGTIPGQTAGTTVNYYVFSSAMPTNLFTSEKIWSVNADGQSVEIEKFGFCMLAIANNGGSYAYTTAAEQTERVPGNVWHNPGAYEPFDSATMRDPETVREGDTPYIRLGSYPRVDSGSTDAPDLVYLWYRVNSGTWYHRTMGTATTSQDYANNDYFTNSLPTDKMVEGNVIEYIFEAAYANSGTLATTFVGTTNQTDSVVYTNKATAQANPFRFTVAAAPVVVLDPGNVWHIPASAEVNGKTMRDPVNPGEGNDVTLYLGNQSDYQDGWMTSANVKYRVGTSGAWTTLALGWESGAGGENSNNAFWTNAIPAVNEGQTVQYYFEALFANSTVLGTTYVYTTNNGTGCAKAMEEADAQASPFSYTATARVYNLGNCWHIPGQFEPWPKATMRNPCYPSAGDAICFFVGNQAHGDGGNPGNMTGGTLYHRASGASAWSTVALEHEADSENNKYWKAILPAGTYASAGDMEYYVEVTYSDHDTTYLGTDSGARSQTFATAAEAQQHLFTCPVGDTAGREPGYMWHAGNAVVAGTNAVQFWVKIGYTKDGTDWADTVQLRYNFKPVGTNGVPKDAVRTGRTAKKRMVRALSSYSTANFVRDHEEEDSSEHGNAVWWSCTLTDDNFMDSEQYLEYEIVAKNSRGNDTWRWADYRTGSATNQFYYTMFQPGSGALTVNGLNADYTTSKFFIDEAAGETVTLDVVYSPAYGTPYAVEIFSNVGRRDYWNADIDDNHIADSIFPPSGDLITSNTVGSYFAAIPMERESPTGPYKKTLTVGKTGAYRLTARYKETAGDFWHYYSDNGIRDHAIVISPKKVLQQRVYEINGMTAKASSPTEAGHSTFEDLIEGADSFAEFGIPYLNKIQANCLWFQPIHTSSEQGLMVGGEPGSPYAAKDYFSVSKWYGKEVNGQRTTAQALTEFQDFVAACDAGKSPSMSQSYVGTINIMLDGVFNHTSWDAVFGVMGETMGLVPAGQGANTPIASVMPGWYANCSDYGAPATWYNGPGWGNHDIACGPDRGDFGKWEDTAELFYGSYSALVRHNPDNNGDYLNENDIYRYDEMDTNTTVKLWEYMGSYVPYWLEKTGHDFGNEHMGELDANGVALDDYGIDGLRCDFGQGLPPQFWEYCINRARAKKWNFMFMAESLDGGKVSYRSNRHFDILNESFVFAARNAGNPSELLAVTDDKKAAYNGGAVLLNLTSHDEVMPYSDPWKTASRYAMLATVKGLPMTMYGQEQGTVPLTGVTGDHKEGSIVETNAPWTGFAKFELNFGKWVADFKTWNMMTIWTNPPSTHEGWDWWKGRGVYWEGDDGTQSHGMAQLYGHVNWARASSPALQSDVQWMLDRTEGYRSSDIWAMAKAEEYGALANGKDAVLAFVLFVNDTHYATAQTFSIPAGAASMLGLEAGESYTARNLAAGNAEQILWTKTTEELTSEGVWVNFTADQNGSSFYDDGAMVQFLKLEKYVAPAAHTITVTVGANGSVSPNGAVSVNDGASQAFTITANAGYRISSVLTNGGAVAEFGNSDTNISYTWENVTADGTLAASFEAKAPVVEGVTIPVDWIATNYPAADPSDYQTLVEGDGNNGRPVWQSYVAGLDPTDATSDMVVGAGIVLGPTNVAFNVSVPAGRKATVTSMDNISSEYDWKDSVVRGGYTNSTSETVTWPFTDNDWNGIDIRFYRLQMQMADTP